MDAPPATVHSLSRAKKLQDALRETLENDSLVSMEAQCHSVVRAHAEDEDKQRMSGGDERNSEELWLRALDPTGLESAAPELISPKTVANGFHSTLFDRQAAFGGMAIEMLSTGKAHQPPKSLAGDDDLSSSDSVNNDRSASSDVLRFLTSHESGIDLLDKDPWTMIFHNHHVEDVYLVWRRTNHIDLPLLAAAAAVSVSFTAFDAASPAGAGQPVFLTYLAFAAFQAVYFLPTIAVNIWYHCISRPTWSNAILRARVFEHLCQLSSVVCNIVLMTIQFPEMNHCLQLGQHVPSVVEKCGNNLNSVGLHVSFLSLLYLELRARLAIPSIAMGGIGIVVSLILAYPSPLMGKIIIVAVFHIVLRAVTIFGLWKVSRVRRSQFETWVTLQRKASLLIYRRKEMTDLINALIPATMLQKLSLQEALIDVAPNCTVSVCRIHDFLRWSSHHLPMTVVKVVDHLHTAFDAHVRRRSDIQRVKSVGDRYLTVHGLGHAFVAPEGADEEDPVFQFAQWQCRLVHSVSSLDLSISFGIHTGPCCAGIVGSNSLWYEVFGEAPEIAARLATTGPSWAIHASTTAFDSHLLCMASIASFREGEKDCRTVVIPDIHRIQVRTKDHSGHDGVHNGVPLVVQSPKQLALSSADTEASSPSCRSDGQQLSGSFCDVDQVATSKRMKFVFSMALAKASQQEEEEKGELEGDDAILPDEDDSKGLQPTSPTDANSAVSGQFFGYSEAKAVLEELIEAPEVSEDSTNRRLGWFLQGLQHLRSAPFSPITKTEEGVEKLFITKTVIQAKKGTIVFFSVLLSLLLIASVEGDLTPVACALVAVNCLSAVATLVVMSKATVESAIFSTAALLVLSLISYALPLIWTSLCTGSIVSGSQLSIGIFVLAGGIFHLATYVSWQFYCVVSLIVCFQVAVFAAGKDSGFFGTLAAIGFMAAAFTVIQYGRQRARSEHYRIVAASRVVTVASHNEFRLHQGLLGLLLPKPLIAVVEEKLAGTKTDALVASRDLCVLMIRFEDLHRRLADVMHQPQEAFVVLENVHEILESALKAQYDDGPSVLEKVYSMGDEVLVAGPVHRRREIDAMAASRGMRTLKEINATDMLLMAVDCAMKIIADLRRQPLESTIMLNADAAHCAVVGINPPTFGVIGPAVRVAEAMLAASSRGKVYATNHVKKIVDSKTPSRYTESEGCSAALVWKMPAERWGLTGAGIQSVYEVVLA